MMRNQVVIQLGVVCVYRLRSPVFKVNPSGYCNKSIEQNLFSHIKIGMLVGVGKKS